MLRDAGNWNILINWRFLLAPNVNYLCKCPFRTSVYMIEILGDIRKNVVLFYRLSDLLTHLKFQYSEVIHVTSFLIDVVLKSFRYLLMFPKNISLCLGSTMTFTLFYFIFFFSGLFFEHSASFKERRQRRRGQSTPQFIHMVSRRVKEVSLYYFLIDQDRRIL